MSVQAECAGRSVLTWRELGELLTLGALPSPRLVFGGLIKKWKLGQRSFPSFAAPYMARTATACEH